MKAAKIALSSLIVTSLVFAVACADKRGFKARRLTPEEFSKITGQKRQGAPAPGVATASGPEASGPATAPAPNTSEPRASGAGSAPSLSSGDEAAMSGWAILVNESTRAQDAQAGTADNSPDGDAPASKVAEAAEKLKEINEASLRVESTGVIKGKTATLVAKGSGAGAKLELGLDALLEIVSRGEKQEISVHGKAELTPEVQISEKKIVSLELTGKDKNGTERKVEGVEAYGACKSTVETPKDCKQVVVMILVKASDTNKFAAITFYQVNPTAANGLLEKTGSSLGDRYKSFEEARISAPAPESGADAPKEQDAAAASASPAVTPPASVVTGADQAEDARAAAEAAQKAAEDEAERKRELNRFQTPLWGEKASVAPAPVPAPAAATPPAQAASAPAPKATSSSDFVPSKNKPHPDVADTAGNGLSRLKERFMNWWNGDQAPEAQKREPPKKEEQGEKSPLEQRSEEASPFAHGA